MEHQLPYVPSASAAPAMSLPDNDSLSPLRGTRFLTLVLRQQHAILDGRVPTPEDARRILSMMRAATPNPIAVLSEYGEWTEDTGSGEQHFLWHGPFNRSGTPIMYHWYDSDGTHHKDYPVYKILWSSCRTDPLTRSVRKLAICDEPTCANPACYEKQFVMVYPGRESSTRTQRQRRREDLGARKGYMHPDQIITRPDGATYVVCESKHLLNLTPEQAMRKMAERAQVYCQECEYVDRAYRDAPHPQREERKGMVWHVDPRTGEGEWLDQDVASALVYDDGTLMNPELDTEGLYAYLDKEFGPPAEDVDNAT